MSKTVDFRGVRHVFVKKDGEIKPVSAIYVGHRLVWGKASPNVEPPPAGLPYKLPFKLA